MNTETHAKQIAAIDDEITRLNALRASLTLPPRQQSIIVATKKVFGPALDLHEANALLSKLTEVMGNLNETTEVVLRRTFLAIKNCGVDSITPSIAFIQMNNALEVAGHFPLTKTRFADWLCLLEDGNLDDHTYTALCDLTAEDLLSK